jgi:hypothetical protein
MYNKIYKLKKEVINEILNHVLIKNIHEWKFPLSWWKKFTMVDPDDLEEVK